MDGQPNDRMGRHGSRQRIEHGRKLLCATTHTHGNGNRYTYTNSYANSLCDTESNSNADAYAYADTNAKLHPLWYSL